ncbi:MAG: HEPN domain-containing protein [Chloroflexi bacterium]|nr:HEPN domain-containing protein [Chloroflexota bacterium]
MKPEVAVLFEKAASSRAAVLLAGRDYLDFAASRAYYALSYAAEALLLTEGLSFSSHAAVSAGFGCEVG